MIPTRRRKHLSWRAVAVIVPVSAVVAATLTNGHALPFVHHLALVLRPDLGKWW